MKATILTVGTEILFGQIVNTNAAYLSQQLNGLGIDVLYHHTVGDNSHRLKDLLSRAFEETDLVITTGGLGPTEDDLTKETVCEVMGDELVRDEAALAHLRDYEKRTGRKMTDNNYKQAYLPSRAAVFINESGTAPAFALEADGRTAICLPGPPRELKWLFENKVRPYLEERSGESIFYRQLRLFGIGESALETRLLPLIDPQTDPTIATYAKEGECSVRVASKRKSKREAEEAVDEMCGKIAALVGEYIYSYDNEELYALTGRMLLEKKLTVSCAESLTGGLFAKTLTDIPGISAVFDRGIVTYSNRAKMEELGVSGRTLDSAGAVSRETAEEMALGLYRKTGSDVCVSATGIAGPDGGSDEKPVGLVYLGLCFRGRTTVRECRLTPPFRNVIRNSAMLNMFDMIYKAIR